MRAELAEHGFRFCMESLEVKLEKHKELLGEEPTGEWHRGAELERVASVSLRRVT